MTTLAEASTASSPSSRLVERVARGLGRFSRRGFLVQTAVVGSALAVDPKGYVLRPQTAAATVCGPAASCSAGYTVMCCTINQGVNACPPGTFAAGWWKAADSSWCCGGYRYITDCNATCSDCRSGCSGDHICDKGCWSCNCRCGSTATCDQRKVCCNGFRYGQCNTHVRCSGGVACRVVSCVAPYRWANCTTTSLSDNSTAEHNAPCNQGCGPILTLYNSLNSLGSPLGASTGPERAVGDGRGRYVNYQHGAISWTAATGAHSVTSYTYRRWAQLGREQGALGYPTGERLALANGWVQHFDHGALADTTSSYTSFVSGTFYLRWKQFGAQSGVLGLPIGDRLTRTNRWIQYFERGVLADTSTSTTAGLNGVPYSRWCTLGGEKSVLGYPVSDRILFANGWTQVFEQGAMCDTTSSYTVYLVAAPWTRWKALGRERGVLGFATSDAVAAPGGGGGGQHFVQGDLWWRAAGPAFVVVGGVLSAWAADGGAGGRWGYPLADAVTNPDATSSQTFEGGVLTV